MTTRVGPRADVLTMERLIIACLHGQSSGGRDQIHAPRNKAQKFTTAKENEFSVSGVLLRICFVNGKFKDQCTISVAVPSL